MVGLFRQRADPHRNVDRAKGCEASQQRASDVLQRDTQCLLYYQEQTCSRERDRTMICTARLCIVVHLFERREIDPELFFSIWVRRRFDQRCIGLG